MLHEEVPYPERQPESSGTSPGFQHLKGILQDGTVAKPKSSERAERVLHSLGTLQDSGQLSPAKSKPFESILQHLSSEQTGSLEQLDQLAHRLLFFDVPSEWQQLNELTKGLGEVQEAVASRFLVAFLDLASSAPDQELFVRVLETFSALLKRDDELIENNKSYYLSPKSSEADLVVPLVRFLALRFLPALDAFAFLFL